jgi:hypothetical protein
VLGCGSTQAEVVYGLGAAAGDLEGYSLTDGSYFNEIQGHVYLEGDLQSDQNGLIYGLTSNGRVAVADPRTASVAYSFSVDINVYNDIALSTAGILYGLASNGYVNGYDAYTGLITSVSKWATASGCTGATICSTSS